MIFEIKYTGSPNGPLAPFLSHIAQLWCYKNMEIPAMNFPRCVIEYWAVRPTPQRVRDYEIIFDDNRVKQLEEYFRWFAEPPVGFPRQINSG